MLDLESILAEWKEDSKIDISTLAECSKNTPELHAKYLEYHAQTRLRLKKAEFKQKELLKHRLINIVLLIGIIIGYILGHLFPV